MEDYNGNVFLVGAEHGAEVTGGTAVSGSAMGDLSGYTLALSANETRLASIVDGATAADPFAGLAGATPTIVVGTNS